MMYSKLHLDTYNATSNNCHSVVFLAIPYLKLCLDGCQLILAIQRAMKEREGGCTKTHNAHEQTIFLEVLCC